MTTRLIGARVRRNEDNRLLQGRGCFVDDVNPRGVLHAAGVRSPHACARIVRIDATRARALPGVHLVLTASDLGDLNEPGPLLIPHPGLTHPRTQRPLAVDRVRYVGELVAFVVAEDRYLAEDAVDLIEVEYEGGPAVIDLEHALDPAAPRVHEDVPGNRAAPLVPLAAIRLARPVKWTEDRREHLLAANQERGQLHAVEVAIDGDGRILGLRDRFVHDTGAYAPYGIVVPLITSTQLPGPYRLRNYHVEFDVAYTNKAAVSPYRGAGRPHGAFVMERVIGLIARELGVEPVEVRRRNFIRPDEFPWDVGLTFQDGGPTRYDSGDYPAGLEMALDMIGHRDFRARQADARARGRYLGLGVGCYVEGTGIGPYEGAHVRVEPSGQVFVASGLTTQGQGHATTFAQIAAEVLGCDPTAVTVVTGDTRRFNWGAGTYASRALVVGGTAVHAAASKVRDKALRIAAELLEASPDDLELRDGRVCVRGVPGRGLALGALATVANPIRYAYGKEAAEAALRLVKPRTGAVLAEGEEPGLEAFGYYAPPQSTFASGCHASIVEVDVATGDLRILRYVVQHDCGTVVNPMIVEGQIRGGVAQGIGGAFYERIVYDGSGQPLTTTFMDFLIPTAMEIPAIEVGHTETPSPLNPLGAKGIGEGGAIPGPAVIAEAIDDALATLGVRVREMPLDPPRLLALIESARRAR